MNAKIRKKERKLISQKLETRPQDYFTFQSIPPIPQNKGNLILSCKMSLSYMGLSIFQPGSL